MRHGQFEITIKVVQLLEKLKENKAHHNENFEKAVKKYRERVIKSLEAALNAARLGKEYRTHFALVRPENMLDEYNTIISMLEMSVDEVITLNKREYENFVLDKWDWSDRFTSNTLSYLQ